MEGKRGSAPVLVWLAAALLIGCGEDDDAERERAAQPGDRPAEAPAGWRSVRNGEARFTIAVPRSWTARTKGSATLIRSPRKLMAVTVAADRSATGRDAEPEGYARDTLIQLPGFEGSVGAGATRIRGSPYRSARIDGTGSVATSRLPQRITITAFGLPGSATYTVIAFRDARGLVSGNERTLDRMLRTFRAG